MYYDPVIEDLLTVKVKERGIAKIIVELKTGIEIREYQENIAEHKERNRITLARIKNLRRLSDLGASVAFKLNFVKMENKVFFNKQFSPETIETNTRRLENFWGRH